MKVSLFTGGGDPHYALGLLSSLTSQDIVVDFIGNDSMKDADAIQRENVTYYNLRGNQNPYAPIKAKIIRILEYYLKLIKYAASTDSEIFHILWLNKFTYFDMTLLNIYYKFLGKKLTYTAHNINIRKRDGRDTLINRLSLFIMYKLVDHIFVHTEKMKQQLINDFHVIGNKVSVIPFGINDIIPASNLTCVEAKKRFNLEGKKVLLFFGNIAPYKGLEDLILALVHLKKELHDFKLIVAGRIKNCEEYWGNIEKIIEENNLAEYVLINIDYVPDETVEEYFKAADVLLLPYKYIYQSGVVFLSYNFGLPVIATNVGSLREDVIEGENGFICKPNDAEDLAQKIYIYFKSDLYKNLERNRDKIIKYAREKYSWDKTGETTYSVYRKFLEV